LHIKTFLDIFIQAVGVLAVVHPDFLANTFCDGRAVTERHQKKFIPMGRDISASDLYDIARTMCRKKVITLLIQDEHFVDMILQGLLPLI